MTYFKIKLIWIAVLLMAMALFTACQSNQSLKIGLVGSMNTEISVSGSQGAEMAVDEFNKNGGLDGELVELVIRDDEGKKDVALQTDKELVEDGVKFIIGHFTSGIMNDVIEYANDQDVLMISPTASVDTLLEKDDHLIKFIGSAGDEAIAISDVAKKFGDKRFAVLYDSRNTGFADNLANFFKAEMMAKAKETPLLLAYNPEKKEELEVAFEKIREDRPEGILLITDDEESAMLAKKLKVVAPEARLYNSMWADTADLIKFGGSDVNGMIIVDGVDLSDNGDAFTAFKDTYTERYREAPDYAAVYAYEATMALLEAIKETKSADPDTVKETIIDKTNYQGLQEPFVIDAYGDCTRTYFTFEIVNGELERIQ